VLPITAVFLFFNRIRPLALMCAPANTRFVGRAHASLPRKRHIDQFSHFCTVQTRTRGDRQTTLCQDICDSSPRLALVGLVMLAKKLMFEQEAFEKCWAHSPVRAAARRPAIHQVSLLSRRTPPAHRCLQRRRRRRQRQRVTAH